MIHHLLRRLALGLVTLALITFLVYGLIRAIPGTPLTAVVGQMDPSRRLNPDDIKRLEAAYGLDKPWYEAYFLWVANVARGDLGKSFSGNAPVAQLIGERIGPTLALSGGSLLLTWVLSIPLGLYTAARSGKPDERAVSLVLYMLYSVPTFVAALALQLTFSIWSEGQPWEMPLFGMTSGKAHATTAAWIVDVAWHSTLPLICMTYVSLAWYSRFINSNLQEVLRQDYIRTARAKGVGPVRVLAHHAFRNTLIPLVTLLGLSLPALLSGSVIIEQIFTWPGMGRLFFESIGKQDYPTLMGLTLMFSVLTLTGQLLADILYAFVDPRVSLDS
jgi:peptide/nickel transport system permease protein